MEMINGEKKLHVWLYKYEQDGVSPVFEVDGSRQEVEYIINNSVDSLYTFCKLEFADDVTNEIFNNTRYRGYSLLCETNDGRAYSSPNGEMLYTPKVRLSTEGGDTILSLLTYILFFSVVGIGICEIVQRLFSGALNITSTFNLLKQRMGSFNIFSESYPVRENLEEFWNVIVQIFVKR